MSVLWHLGLLLVAALACHGKLARARPPSAHLTEFYLLIALGGVLGGLFNAIVAPVVFSSLAEYPLAMVVACALVAGGAAPSSRFGRRRMLAVAGPLIVIALALVTYSEALTIRVELDPLTRLLGLEGNRVIQWIARREYTLNPHGSSWPGRRRRWVSSSKTSGGERSSRAIRRPVCGRTTSTTSSPCSSGENSEEGFAPSDATRRPAPLPSPEPDCAGFARARATSP